MTVLITGTAGFIGAAVAERLLARGEQLVGVDNLNPYYDPALKRARLQRLPRHRGVAHQQMLFPVLTVRLRMKKGTKMRLMMKKRTRGM